MKVIYAFLLLALVGTAFAGTSKESKKKNFKIRSDLATNETLAVSESEKSNSTVAEKEADKEEAVKAPAEDTVADIANLGESTKEKEPVADSEKIEGEAVAVDTVKPLSLTTKMRNLLKRVMEMMGLSYSKRKSRKMKHDETMDGIQYVQDIRTVYNAIGKQDCMRRVACTAGTYLREVKGKELLILVLKKFAPAFLAEPVNHLTEGAIYKDSCEYSCEDDY